MATDRKLLASKARLFMAQQYQGVLSTHSVKCPGYPFGSVVPYDLTESGGLVIYISLIAEHYRNLKENPRASLIALDPYAFDDPQAYARCTVIVEFEIIEEDRRKQFQDSYARRFPGSINYEIAHNFVFMLGRPSKIRWIGGFGEMGWIDGDDYSGVLHDPLAYASKEIIAHMHADHSEVLAILARAHGVKNEIRSLRMGSVNKTGFTLTVNTGSKSEILTVNFPSEVDTLEACRAAIISLVNSAKA